ncbi:MAG: ABC transporter permease [Defluviitaleaceae bacterium]|nr:ABC transporter permease [Defluviitaleaceae bacterium]
MGTFLTFAGKEFTEIMRTKRLLVLFIVFMIFAFTGPMLARYLMEFIGLLMPAEEMAVMMDMMGEIGGETTFHDSYALYYEFVTQMGIFATMLMFMGIVLDEKRRGTASLMMMKGVKHSTFVLAKFAVVAIAMFVVVVASSLVVHFYTYILFEEVVPFADMLFGSLAFWLFVLFFASISIFFSTVAKTIVMSAVSSIVTFFVFYIIGLISGLNDYLPSVMYPRAVELTLGHQSDLLIWNILITIAAITVLLGSSIHILKKKEL